MRVFLSTGEVSGDVIGARVARQIRLVEPSAELVGIGGPHLEAAGVELTSRTNELGTVGISEAFRTLPGHARAFFRLRRLVRSRRPDVAVLIGNDVFNVLVGRWLRARGVPTLAYFPPQAWIWRSLSRPIAKSFDVILTSFPEEHEVYEKTAAATTFVGHYLCDLLRPVEPPERAASRLALGIGAGDVVVGVLPGSRVHEIRGIAPILLDAAVELGASNPRVRVVLPMADPGDRIRLESELQRRALPGLVVGGDRSHEVMRASDVLLLASGTASLEAALLGVPMVIAYRVSLLTIAVVRSAIRLGLILRDTVGLPNLVLGRELIPEFVQSDLTAHAVAREALSLLEDPLWREENHAALSEVRRRLESPGTVEHVANAVLELASTRRLLRPAPVPSPAPGNRPATEEGR